MQTVLKIKTNKQQCLVDITAQVAVAIKKSKVKEGICIIYVQHATAAIVINENYDPAVCEDIINALSKIIPEHAGWKHDRIDNNAAAHIKSAIIGPSEVIPVKNGELQLGRWQGIALAELDGPRERKIIVNVLKN